MMLELWRPYVRNGFPSFENQVNRLFSDFFTQPAAASNWTPAVDMVETADAIELKADLPGLSASDLDVKVENGLLTLRGERKEEKEGQSGAYHLYERRSGSFVRSFDLPALVDANAVKARYTDGVLTVTLPKREEAKPKSIQVKIE